MYDLTSNDVSLSPIKMHMGQMFNYSFRNKVDNNYFDVTRIDYSRQSHCYGELLDKLNFSLDKTVDHVNVNIGFDCISDSNTDWDRLNHIPLDACWTTMDFSTINRLAERLARLFYDEYHIRVSVHCSKNTLHPHVVTDRDFHTALNHKMSIEFADTPTYKIFYVLCTLRRLHTLSNSATVNAVRYLTNDFRDNWCGLDPICLLTITDYFNQNSAADSRIGDLYLKSISQLISFLDSTALCKDTNYFSTKMKSSFNRFFSSLCRDSRLTYYMVDMNFEYDLKSKNLIPDKSSFDNMIYSDGSRMCHWSKLTQNMTEDDVEPLITYIRFLQHNIEYNNHQLAQ